MEYLGIHAITEDTSAETLVDCLAQVRLVRRQVARRHGTGAPSGDTALLRTLDGVEALLAELVESMQVRH